MLSFPLDAKPPLPAAASAGRRFNVSRAAPGFENLSEGWEIVSEDTAQATGLPPGIRAELIELRRNITVIICTGGIERARYVERHALESEVRRALRRVIGDGNFIIEPAKR